MVSSWACTTDTQITNNTIQNACNGVLAGVSVDASFSLGTADSRFPSLTYLNGNPPLAPKNILISNNTFKGLNPYSYHNPSQDTNIVLWTPTDTQILNNTFQDNLYGGAISIAANPRLSIGKSSYLLLDKNLTISGNIFQNQLAKSNNYFAIWIDGGGDSMTGGNPGKVLDHLSITNNTFNGVGLSAPSPGGNDILPGCIYIRMLHHFQGAGQPDFLEASNVNISNNSISNVAGAGISTLGLEDSTISGNTLTNVGRESLFMQRVGGTMVCSNNSMTNCGGKTSSSNNSWDRMYNGPHSAALDTSTDPAPLSGQVGAMPVLNSLQITNNKLAGPANGFKYYVFNAYPSAKSSVSGNTTNILLPNSIAP